VVKRKSGKAIMKRTQVNQAASPVPPMLHPGERLDDLLIDGLQIIQDDSEFRFSVDAVLLAHFATLRRGDRVVDLGTGTGVIPLLLCTRVELQSITGVEIQAEVAARAVRSVEHNGLGRLIRIVQGDLREIERVLPGVRVDLVTANPPYLPVGSGVSSPKESLALARHEVCCNLEDVVRSAAYLLGSGGRFALVHRPERLAEILSLMAAYRLIPKRLRLVHPRVDQEAKMVLVEGVRDARPGLRISPPLVVLAGDDYSPEIRAIYREQPEAQTNGCDATMASARPRRPGATEVIK